jgi:[ribosomal protein S5]-alanine N-acetyltransferase
MSDLLGTLFRHRGWPAWVTARGAVPPTRAMSTDAAAAVEDPRGASVLETERLRLRELTLDDAPFVLRLLNDPSFLRYIGDRGVRNLTDARRYIACGMRDSYSRHGFGLWLVELPALSGQSSATGYGIGLCGMVSRAGLPSPDIGFAFLPAWWSQGYAHEAAAAVMAHAQRVIGLRRVLAIASPRNASSLRLLSKLGFAYERDVLMPGESEPVAMFAHDCGPDAHEAAATAR